MAFFQDLNQQHAMHNPWAQLNPQLAQSYFTQPLGGLGQAAFGQYGQQWGTPNPNIGAGIGWGAQQGWGQRQLTQQDVSEVVRQLVPLLPQVLAHAQQSPVAIQYGAYGQGARLLSPQDVNEVVRQILPILPQIVGALQQQVPLQAAAMYGGGYGGHGQGQPGQLGQTGWGQTFAQNPYGQQHYFQQPFGQVGLPPFQAAFGTPIGWGQNPGQRQLTQQDIGEVVRQLAAILPQVIGNQQAFNQQRTI
jgi:hypothetical protein